MAMIFGGFTSFTLIDYPKKTAAMVYTIGCNFRCPYCHNPELVDETVETTLPDTYVLDFLRGRQHLLDGVVITGGEPTIHGDNLLGFMREVKELGFLVKLDTNGTNPTFLLKAIEKGVVDYIAMDIKAPLHSYHKTVGRPVDMHAIEKSIDILRSGRIPYEFRTTVIKSLLSEEDLEVMFQTIKGASSYYLQKFIPTKILNPQFKKKVTYSDEEFLTFKHMAEKYVTYCGIR
jgi:pyruvate formate lyase activating enzyme